MKKILLILFIFCLTGCASIVSRGPKTLPIMSKPDAADCEIIDIKTGNTIVKAKTPFTAVLDVSSGYFQNSKYKIKFSKDGYVTQEVALESDINPWYFGNIVFGGLVGILLVDPATGAMWKIHEDNINLSLSPDTPEGREALIRAEEAKEKKKAEEAKKAKEEL